MAGTYYKTQFGDTWDLICFKFYGSYENLSLLFQNNLDKIDIAIFDDDTEIYIPDNTYYELENKYVPDSYLPTWLQK